jgi:hypothetical protein
MASNQLIDSKKQRETFYAAIKELAKVVGCDSSEAGGREFARVMLPAISAAAYGGGDVLKEIANKLLAFRPTKRA